MAVILGHGNQPCLYCNQTSNSDYFELTQKARLQQQLIEDLMKLNLGQQEEIKRLVGEYDNLYEKYQHSLKFIQKPKENE
jgi:predicted ATPase